MNLAVQGSKVARSRGKVPSLHQDPKDAGFQGSRIYSRSKGSKILRLQGSKVPLHGLYHPMFFQGFMVPGFSDT